MSIPTIDGKMAARVAAGVALATATPAFALTSADAPQSVSLTGVIRDFPPESAHVDFQVNPSATPGARSARNIGLELDDDGKPVYVGGGRKVIQEWRDSAGRKISSCAPAMPGDTAGSFGNADDGGIASASTFAQWFRDVPGINMSRLWSIQLERNSSGVYEYDTNNFHPIDSQLLGNGPDEHNFYFTYEIVCTFTHDADAGQFVWFKGDDDTWVFIDGKLGIDHSGIASNREQRIDLNRFNLVDGQDYQLHFFLAERYQPQSQFHLETNILLRSTGANTIFACFD